MRGQALLGGCNGCPLCGGILKTSDLIEPEGNTEAYTIYEDKFLASSNPDSWGATYEDAVNVDLIDVEDYMAYLKPRMKEPGVNKLYRQLNTIRKNMIKGADYVLTAHTDKNDQNYVSFTKIRPERPAFEGPLAPCTQQQTKRMRKDGRPVMRYYQDGRVVPKSRCPPSQTEFETYEPIRRKKYEGPEPHIVDIMLKNRKTGQYKLDANGNPIIMKRCMNKNRFVSNVDCGLPAAIERKPPSGMIGPHVVNIKIKNRKTGEYKKDAQGQLIYSRRCMDGNRFVKNSECKELPPVTYTNRAPTTMEDDIIYTISSRTTRGKQKVTHFYNRKIISNNRYNELINSGVPELVRKAGVSYPLKGEL